MDRESLVSTSFYISAYIAVKMHYLNFFYQILIVINRNSLIWPMIKYHLDRKLSSKVAYCSVIGSGDSTGNHR